MLDVTEDEDVTEVDSSAEEDAEREVLFDAVVDTDADLTEW